jgi:hypothetical protein
MAGKNVACGIQSKRMWFAAAELNFSAPRRWCETSELKEAQKAKRTTSFHECAATYFLLHRFDRVVLHQTPLHTRKSVVGGSNRTPPAHRRGKSDWRQVHFNERKAFFFTICLFM